MSFTPIPPDIHENAQQRHIAISCYIDLMLLRFGSCSRLRRLGDTFLRLCLYGEASTDTMEQGGQRRPLS